MSVREAGLERSHRLRLGDGRFLPFPVERWLGDLPEEEDDLLARATGPVLDVGCGPARHTVALLGKGIPALGIDVSGSAVALARRRGAPVVRGSVFQPLPREGLWATALLVDGNIGIGGSPPALLRRLREVLRDGGRALAEVEPPGAPTESMWARIERGPQATSWFRWAVVGADRIGSLARRSGFDLAELWTRSGRWFARLEAR